ncbi:MAG: hypothetical protein V1859_10625 [archaeon]
MAKTIDAKSELSMAKQKRVNIVLDEDIHLKAKVIAVLKNITLNEFFEKAISEAIEKDKNILDKMKK